MEFRDLHNTYIASLVIRCSEYEKDFIFQKEYCKIYQEKLLLNKYTNVLYFKEFSFFIIFFPPKYNPTFFLYVMSNSKTFLLGIVYICIYKKRHDYKLRLVTTKKLNPCSNNLKYIKYKGITYIRIFSKIYDKF